MSIHHGVSDQVVSDVLWHLRAVVEAKDAEIAGLRAEAEAARERERRLEPRLAELERRLGMDSTDSGTPSSRERIGPKEAQRARSPEAARSGPPDRPARAARCTRRPTGRPAASPGTAAAGLRRRARNAPGPWPQAGRRSPSSSRPGLRVPLEVTPVVLVDEPRGRYLRAGGQPPQLSALFVGQGLVQREELVVLVLANTCRSYAAQWR